MSLVQRILPVVIYAVLFTIVSVCTYIADRKYKEKLSSYTYAAIAILLLCGFAAFRAETVGTDVLVYAKPNYFAALQSSSFSNMLERLNVVDTGYALLTYISAHIFGDFKWLLFFTELLIVWPVMAVLYKNRDHIPMWLGMLTFLAIFYLESFNVMRQMIAACVLLLAFVCFREGNKIKALLLAFCASSFHSTAVVGILLLVSSIVHQKIKSKQYRVMFVIAVCVGTITIFGFWEYALTSAINIGLLPTKMSHYVNLFNGTITYSRYDHYFNLGRSGYFDLLFRILALILVGFCYKKPMDAMAIDNVTERENIFGIRETLRFIVLLSTLIFSGVFLMLHTVYGYRVTLYLDMFLILALPACIHFPQPKLDFGKIEIKTLAVIIYLLSYWMLMYMLFGYHGTLPLKFNI